MIRNSVYNGSVTVTGVPEGSYDVFVYVWEDNASDDYTLLDFGAPDVAVAEIARAAEAGGVPFKLVRNDSAESRQFYQATLILVRPDQFIAWTSDGDVTDAAGIAWEAHIGGFAAGLLLLGTFDAPAPVEMEPPRA